MSHSLIYEEYAHRLHAALDRELAGEIELEGFIGGYYMGGHCARYKIYQKFAPESLWQRLRPKKQWLLTFNAEPFLDTDIETLIQVATPQVLQTVTGELQRACRKYPIFKQRVVTCYR